MWKANIQKIPTTTLDPEIISLDSTDITDLNSAPVITSENLINNLPLANTTIITSEQDTILDPYSSEEYIKVTLNKLLNEVKDNHNFVFQWLFIMYLEDMISKVK